MLVDDQGGVQKDGAHEFASTTLTPASPTTGTSVPYNTPYVVSGCGYGSVG